MRIHSLVLRGLHITSQPFCVPKYMSSILGTKVPTAPFPPMGPTGEPTFSGLGGVFLRREGWLLFHRWVLLRSQPFLDLEASSFGGKVGSFSTDGSYWRANLFWTWRRLPLAGRLAPFPPMGPTGEPTFSGLGGVFLRREGWLLFHRWVLLGSQPFLDLEASSFGGKVGSFSTDGSYWGANLFWTWRRLPLAGRLAPFPPMGPTGEPTFSGLGGVFLWREGWLLFHRWVLLGSQPFLDLEASSLGGKVGSFSTDGSYRGANLFWTCRRLPSAGRLAPFPPMGPTGEPTFSGLGGVFLRREGWLLFHRWVLLGSQPFLDLEASSFGGKVGSFSTDGSYWGANLFWTWRRLPSAGRLAPFPPMGPTGEPTFSGLGGVFLRREDWLLFHQWVLLGSQPFLDLEASSFGGKVGSFSTDGSYWEANLFWTWRRLPSAGRLAPFPPMGPTGEPTFSGLGGVFLWREGWLLFHRWVLLESQPFLDLEASSFGGKVGSFSTDGSYWGANLFWTWRRLPSAGRLAPFPPMGPTGEPTFSGLGGVFLRREGWLLFHRWVLLGSQPFLDLEASSFGGKVGSFSTDGSYWRANRTWRRLPLAGRLAPFPPMGPTGEPTFSGLGGVFLRREGWLLFHRWVLLGSQPFLDLEASSFGGKVGSFSTDGSYWGANLFWTWRRLPSAGRLAPFPPMGPTGEPTFSGLGGILLRREGWLLFHRWVLLGSQPFLDLEASSFGGKVGSFSTDGSYWGANFFWTWRRLPSAGRLAPFPPIGPTGEPTFSGLGGVFVCVRGASPDHLSHHLLRHPSLFLISAVLCQGQRMV